MPIYSYRFSSTTLDAFARNTVSWQAVLYVLNHGHPAFKEFIGASVLRVISRDDNDELLMVTLMELADDDDVFEIVTARYLTDEELPAAAFYLKRK